MNSFEPGLIEHQPITQNLLRTIRLISEYKGKQQLFKEQLPQVLETLQEAAIITKHRIVQSHRGGRSPAATYQGTGREKTTPMNARDCWVSL